MKRFLLLITAACIILTGCEQKLSEFKIYPLSPYTDEVKFNNDHVVNKDALPVLRTQYYIVDEATDLTDKTKTRLENFINIKLKKDVQNNKAIYFTFYKSTFTFGPHSVQTKAQLHDEHAKQKLAEFEYKNGRLYNFDFYKDGTYYTQDAETQRGKAASGE